MTNHQGTAAIQDPGAFALAVFLRLHGVADAHPDRFKSGAALRLKDMLRRAREFGVVLHACTIDWKRLTTACLPAIAVTRAGGFLVLGKMDSNGVVVVRPSKLQPKPELLSRADFEREWSGEVLLRNTGRAPASDGASGGLAARLSLLGGDLAQRAGRPSRPSAPGCGACSNAPLRKCRPRRIVPVAVDDDDEGSGVAALVLLLRFHGIGADPEQIRHRFGARRFGIAEMLRCAKDFGLKAAADGTTGSVWRNTPLPAIAALRDGGFLLLGKVGDDKVLVQDPAVAAAGNDDAAPSSRRFGTAALVLMTRARRPRRPVAPLRHHLVSRRHPQIPHLLGEVLRRLVLPPAFRAGFAAVLPGRDRQGAGPSQPEHARRAGYRACHRSRCSRPCSASCAPICSRTRPTASTSSSARGCSATCWRCRSPISRRAASAIRWRACASWKTSAIFSPARR